MTRPNDSGFGTTDVIYYTYLTLLGATAVLLGLAVLIPSWTFVVLAGVAFTLFALLSGFEMFAYVPEWDMDADFDPALMQLTRDGADSGLSRAFTSVKNEPDLRSRPWIRFVSWLFWPLWIVLAVHRQMLRLESGRVWAAWYAAGRFLTLLAAGWLSGAVVVLILRNLSDDFNSYRVDFGAGVWGFIAFVVLCILAGVACEAGRNFEDICQNEWKRNLLRHERTTTIHHYVAGRIGQRVALGWRGEGMVLSDPESHVVALGPPRSGKTTGMLLPTVCGWDGPVLATSTKSDLFARSAFKRLQREGRVLLFDPTGKTPLPQADRSGMVERFLWSPLDGAENYDTARLTATAMIGALPADRDGGYFRDRARQLLAALLHVAALGVDETDRLDTLLRWVSSYSCDEALTIADQLLKADHPGFAPSAHEILFGVAETAKREASGYWSNIARALDGCATAGYRGQYAHRVPVDVASLAAPTTSSRTTIYIVAPSDAQASMAPVVVGFIEALCSAIYATWRDAGLPVLTGELAAPRQPWLFALDELANIAPLPDLPSLLSEGASQGVIVLAALQDLSQARVRYEEAAAGLLSLFGTTVVYPGIRDPQTLELVSLLYGEQQIPMTSTTSATGRRTAREFTPTLTESTQWRRAVLPGEVSAPEAPGYLRVLLPGGRPPVEMRSDQLFHQRLVEELDRPKAQESTTGPEKPLLPPPATGLPVVDP